MYWIDEATVGFTTFGRNGCPVTPETLSRVSDTTLAVEWAPDSSEPCDTNIEPTTFSAPIPDGLDTSQPLTVQLGHGESDTLLPL